MAISRAKKAEKVTMLTRELESSTSAIVGTFAGLTASKDFELRKTVRAAGGSYHVVKNKLAAKASQGSKIEAALQGLKGVSAVAYTSGDPVELAKALTTWVKENSEFTFKLGIVDGKVLSIAEIGELATMPGKEELFSKLLFLLQSPAQRLATVINATGRDLAVVINQAVEKEKFTGTGSTASVSAPAAFVSAAAAAESTSGGGETGAATPVTAIPVTHEPMTETEKAPADAVVDPEAPAAPAKPGSGSNAQAAQEQAAPSQIAQAHAEEAPTPGEAAAAATETIAEHPASEADPVAETAQEAQPENSTASQGGAAADSEPAEG